MAAPTLERSLELVFGHEGGLSMDRADRGNWTSGTIGKGQLKGTKYGISAMAYPTLDIKNLTLEAAASIYRRDYWAKVKGDDLPAGVDHAVFDFAVNSGPARAAMALQRCVGVADDGHIGPLTLAAVNKQNPATLIGKLCSERLAFLRKISTWPKYGKGWTKRVQKVEQEALKMAAAPIPDVEPIANPPKNSWLAVLVQALFKRNTA